MTLQRAFAAGGYPRVLGAAAEQAARHPLRAAGPFLALDRPTLRPRATPDDARWTVPARRLTGGTTLPLPASDVPGARTEKMARVEAALLVTDRPLTLKKIVQYATLIDAADATRQIELLNTAYEQDDSPFRIERVATGFQLLTRPAFAAWLDKRHHRPARMKLSPPALETLTIVAYRQPVTRADVEAVRGVQSGEILKQLMDRGLVRITGEDDTLGRPYLYGTTRQFLEQFGLQNLDDLPESADLRQPATAATVTQADAEEEPDAAAEIAATGNLEDDAESEAAA